MRDAHSITPNLQPISINGCESVVNFGRGLFNYSLFRDKVATITESMMKELILPDSANNIPIGITFEVDLSSSYPETSRLLIINSRRNTCAISYGYTCNNSLYDIRSIMRVATLFNGKVIEYRLTNALRPIVDLSLFNEEQSDGLAEDDEVLSDAVQQDENKIEVAFFKELLIDFKPIISDDIQTYVDAGHIGGQADELQKRIKHLEGITELIATKILSKVNEEAGVILEDYEGYLKELVSHPEEPLTEPLTGERKNCDDFTSKFPLEYSENNNLKGIVDRLISYGRIRRSAVGQIVDKIGVSEFLNQCCDSASFLHGVNPPVTDIDKLSDRQRMDLGLAEFIAAYCKENLSSGSIIVNHLDDKVSLSLKLSERNSKPISKLSDLRYHFYEDALV